MKIYRKIVFDYNFNVIEEDSYDYDGEITKCDGGGPGNAGTQAAADATDPTSDNPGSGQYAGDPSSVDAEANSQTGFNTTGHTGAEAQNIDMAMDLENNIKSLQAIADQATNSYAKSVIGSIISSAKAALSAVFTGAVVAENPVAGIAAAIGTAKNFSKAMDDYDKIDSKDMDAKKAALSEAKAALASTFPGYNTDISSKGVVTVDGEDISGSKGEERLTNIATNSLNQTGGISDNFRELPFHANSSKSGYILKKPLSDVPWLSDTLGLALIGKQQGLAGYDKIYDTLNATISSSGGNPTKEQVASDLIKNGFALTTDGFTSASNPTGLNPYGSVEQSTKATLDGLGNGGAVPTSHLSSTAPYFTSMLSTRQTGIQGYSPSSSGGTNNNLSGINTTGATGMATSNLSLEDQLKTEQLEILRQQRSESDALNKLVYQAAGIIKDPTTGEWRKATEAERRSFMTDTESKEYDLYLQQLERQKMALEGKLPVSPALEKEISDWDSQNQEALTRRLGTNYMTSTPGIQSQERQNERTGLLREEARRGEISAGSSRVLDWKNALNNQGAQALNTYSAIPGRTSGLLTGYSNTLVPYTQQSSINATNDRQAQVLAQDAYYRNQAIKSQENQNKWNSIAKMGGWLFE